MHTASSGVIQHKHRRLGRSAMPPSSGIEESLVASNLVTDPSCHGRSAVEGVGAPTIIGPLLPRFLRTPCCLL